MVSRLRFVVGFALALAAAGGSASAGVAEPPHYIPVHGEVLRITADRSALVRMDPKPPGIDETTPFQLDRTTQALHPGEKIDALLAPQSRQLRRVELSPTYVPGLPDPTVSRTLAIGDAFPDIAFVDQTGHVVRLADFHGRTVLVSFMFTRCADAQICPAISGKFAYLQSHLDSATTHLVEITLDPAFDTPAVLADYGKRFGADPAQWSIVTAEQHDISHIVASFDLASLQNRPGNLVHDDVLVFVDGTGHIASLVPTSDWVPDDVTAAVAHIQGVASNPFQRLRLSAIANIIASCGGAVTLNVILMDSTVFVLGVLVFGGVLAWFGYKIVRGD